MRGIMILADRHYVTDSPIQRSATGYHGELATGGTVFVPAEKLIAFEVYETDAEIEFGLRPRLRQLEAASDRKGG